MYNMDYTPLSRASEKFLIVFYFVSSAVMIATAFKYIMWLFS